MKILIASDIHGSAGFCEAFLKSVKTENPDKILLLGDLLYHGPRNDLPPDYDTGRTMEILNSLCDKVTCVRGNCDSEVDQMVLNFPIMNTYEMIEADGIRFFATHGHQYNSYTLPAFAGFDVMLNGHTHISALKDMGDYYYANPGSVSIPKGGTDHSYMIYEDLTLTIKGLLSGKETESLKIEK